MVCYDNCLMMFHNYSGGLVGKGHEITASVEATNKWFHRLMRDICTPFLSCDELDRIIRGEDIWMHSEEIGDRLKKMTEELDKEEEKESNLLVAKTPRKKQSKKKRVTKKKRSTKE